MIILRRIYFAFIWWALNNNTLSAWAQSEKHSIPDDFCSPYGTYPNLLNITKNDQEGFYPVVIYPDRLIPINDCTNAQSLASPEYIEKSRKRNVWWKAVPRRVFYTTISTISFGKIIPRYHSPQWSIGKYDENRIGMYSSELYQNTSNSVDGYSGKRTGMTYKTSRYSKKFLYLVDCFNLTCLVRLSFRVVVHLGVDLGAPPGTKVYAFWDGIIHSAGYNQELGDYGYVVVIEHRLSLTDENTQPRTVWALYGHMDKGSIRGKHTGKFIKTGTVIGRVGDCHENGGWAAPHLHFQLSLNPPQTHDMPGASTVQDRKRALVDYPDPRHVLGVVH